MTLVLALLACAPTQADHGRSFTAAMSAQADLSRPEAPVVLTGREAEALRIGVGQTVPAATKDGTSATPAASPAAARPTSP